MYGFYIDTSIHQLGYVTGLIRELNGILYTDSELSYKIVEKDFPWISVKYFDDFNPIIDEMVNDKIRVIILQDFQYKKFKTLRDKNVKFVQVFHGACDKSYNINREILKYDLVCVVGEKMYRDLKDKKLDRKKNLIITGNPKADVIFNNIYNRNEEIKKLGLNPDKKNVLYAPTWLDGMGNSSFRKFGIDLPDYFPSEYQLTIKLHPNIYLYNKKLVNKLKSKIKDKKNILLLEDAEDIYDIVPIMAASDLLITDVSGVSHEYIAFLRPMIFLDNKSIIRFLYGRKRTRIWKTGDVVSDIKKLPAVIRKNLSKPNRYRDIQLKVLKEIYSYTDGKSVDRIVKAIKSLV